METLKDAWQRYQFARPWRGLKIPQDQRHQHQARRQLESDLHPSCRCRRCQHCQASAFPSRCEGEHRAHHRRTGDQAEIARQIEQAGDDATLVGCDARHHGRIVGGLKQAVAGADDDDWYDIAGNTEFRPRQSKGANSEIEQADDHRPVRPETIDQASGRQRRQCGNQRAGRQNQPDHGCVQPKRARQIEWCDHQRRHHHRGDDQVHGEACVQRVVAEPRRLDQRVLDPCLRNDKQQASHGGGNQQADIERTKTATPKGHGKRIGG